MDKPQAKVAGERRLAERTEKAAIRLRERRLARKLTQEALAKELGVTANTFASGNATNCRYRIGSYRIWPCNGR